MLTVNPEPAREILAAIGLMVICYFVVDAVVSLLRFIAYPKGRRSREILNLEELIDNAQAEVSVAGRRIDNLVNLLCVSAKQANRLEKRVTELERRSYQTIANNPEPPEKIVERVKAWRDGQDPEVT